MTPAGVSGEVVAEVLAEVEAVGDVVAGWFEVDRSGWSAADRSLVLRALMGVRERTEAAVLDATADWDRHEAWSADGALSPQSWLRAEASLATPDARQTMRSARLLRRSDALAKALASLTSPPGTWPPSAGTSRRRAPTSSTAMPTCSSTRPARPASTTPRP